MSYGLPVIVAFGDGTESDLIRQDLNGVFVKPDDCNELAKAIVTLIKQPALLEKMGQASLKIIRQEMGLDSMVRTFTHVVNSIEYSMR